MDIKIIAGLGNPGREYEGTRHNAGFMVLDRFAEARRIFDWRRSGEALVAETVSPDGERLLLVKPQSFMNRSGGPLGELGRFFKIGAAQIAVAHDDIDLPLGALRVKRGGGDGGHNGLRSIVEALGSPDFVRVRVGVGRPAPAPEGEWRPEVVDWVLGCFGGEEQRVFAEVRDRAVLLIEELLGGSLVSAQRKFNGSSRC